MAMQIIARIREKHGIFVPIRKFFDDPTVRGFSALITELSSEREAGTIDEDIPDASSETYQRE